MCGFYLIQGWMKHFLNTYNPKRNYFLFKLFFKFKGSILIFLIIENKICDDIMDYIINNEFSDGIEVIREKLNNYLINLLHD